MPFVGIGVTIGGQTLTSEAFTGLLDTYSGAAAAYSLRQLKSGVTNAIQVRRASDNATQDIGFVDGQLDTSTLETFCSGTDGYVTTWYDQSGNGNDATQSTAANQPLIVSGGSLTQLNSKAAINGDSANDVFSLSTGVNLSSGYTIFHVSQAPLANSYAMMISSSDTSNRSHLMIFNGLYRFTLAGANYDNYSTIGNRGVQYLWSSVVDGSGNLDTNRNGSAYGSTITSVTGTFEFDNIGTNIGINSFEYFQELIVFNFDQSTNRSDIETNINNFYNIY